MVVGPGLADRHRPLFVICANVLGGCMGTTGPRTQRDDGEGLWGIDFPTVTIRDMVHAQKRLIDHFGIQRLFAVIGGSMGGMQVLEWAATYPEVRVRRRADRHRRLALGAEHRLQRGRAAGDLHRSRLPERQLLAHRRGARARPRRGAHDRAHHLPQRAGDVAQVRAPGARRAGGRPGGQRAVRRHVRGGELPAPPGQHLRAPVRRQQLPDHHPRHRLFRSRRRA